MMFGDKIVANKLLHLRENLEKEKHIDSFYTKEVYKRYRLHELKGDKKNIYSLSIDYSYRMTITIELVAKENEEDEIKFWRYQNIMATDYAFHVGEILKDNLEAIGMSQAELCKKINVSPTIINEIIKGKRGMNIDLAKKLAPVFDLSVKYWMDAQIEYELAKKEGKFLINADTLFESPYSVKEIVDRIICYEKERLNMCEKKDIKSDLTNLKIQKILYFMQKDFIKKEATTLFNEKIEHWAMGPVVPAVYKRLKKYGKDSIIEEKVKDIPLAERIEEKVKFLYKKLCKKTTIYLTELSHKEKVWLGTSENEEITPEMIKKER